MSYYVEYDPQLNNRYPLVSRKTKKLSPMPFLLILASVIVVYSLIQFDLLKVFIPGDPQITAQAFSGMVEQVRTGEPIAEAVFCFFKDIITHEA